MSSAADQIRAWLEDRLDIASVSGDEVRVRECLFCGKSRTLKINLDRRKFFCHHRDCSQSGGLVRLVQAVEGCSFDEAVGIVRSLTRGLLHGHRKLSDVRRSLRRLRAPEEPQEAAVEHPLPDEFIPCWNPETERWRVPKYLTRSMEEGGRGLSRETIKRWGLGFANEGQCEGRVIIPIRCGRLRSWVARAMYPDMRPKYLTAHSAQDDDRFMFGFDELPREAETVVALEGVFDAMRVWSYGYPSIAYLKDGISPGQMALLGALEPRRLVLLPDGGDPRAWERALRTAAALGARFPEVVVGRLVPPAGQSKIDPDSAPRRLVERAIEDARRVSKVSSVQAKRNRVRSPWGS